MAALPAGVGASDQLELLDLNTNPASPLRPSRVVSMGDFLVFVGLTTGKGKELYRSDGTAQGTRLLADIWPGPTGSRPSWVSVVGELGYFAASDPEHGEELWRTDGTPGGTWMVADLVPGPVGSAPTAFAEVGGELYFRAWSPEAGTELWRTDGTSGGTRRVAVPHPGVEDSYIVLITAVENRVLFFAEEGREGLKPWVTDGTAAGTMLLRDIRVFGPNNYSRNSNPLVTFRGEVYFFADDGVHGSELWKTDGTAAGTALVVDLEPGPEGSGGMPVLVYQNELIFAAWSSGATSEVKYRLFATDGTQRGTRLFSKDVPAGNGPSVVFQGKIWAASRFGYEGPVELWATDGTAAGTKLMARIPETTGCGSESFSSLTVVEDRLFFIGHQTGRRWKIWVSDGTEAGTREVTDASVPSRNEIRGLTVLGDEIAYLATDGGSRDFEFWRSDGTGAGTRPLVSVVEENASSLESGDMVALGDAVYFFADSGSGRHLHRSDGTRAGTGPAPSFDRLGAPVFYSTSASPLAAAQDSFYVRTRHDIWRSDGTHRGLEHVLFLDESSPPTSMVVLEDTLFFELAGDLWRGDGQEAVNLTQALPDPAQSTEIPDPGATTSFTFRFADILGAAADRVFFLWNDPDSGRELWSTDGTVAGTRLLHDREPGVKAGFHADGDHRGIEAGPLFYFVADDGAPGYELWRTDGSAAGTILVRTFPAEGSDELWSNVDEMAGTPSGRLYVAHPNSTSGVSEIGELWFSDGTAAGTRLIRELPGSFCGSDLVTIDELALFWVCEERTGGAAEVVYRLWRSDGTKVGTRALATARKRGQAPRLRVAGSRVYFQTENPKELWVSDATQGGTRVLAALGAPGTVFDSDSLTVAGRRLFLAGDDGVHGYEPFTLLSPRHFPRRDSPRHGPSGVEIPRRRLVGAPRG